MTWKKWLDLWTKLKEIKEGNLKRGDDIEALPNETE